MAEGFFKASLLEACTTNSNFSVELTGDAREKYVIGVDPNQGGSDNCGVTVIKMGNPNQIVNVMEIKSKTTQEITTAVQRLCEVYNVIRVFMDRGGGGKAVMDLLEEGYNDKKPILDRENDDNKRKSGRHILEMVNFNPTWISEANFTALSMLEDKRLRFPEPPVTLSDRDGKTFETFNTLKSQMLNIIVTQTPSGALHFDTPKKGQKKDLYSSLILAAHGVRIIERELEEDGPTQLFNKSGVIRDHKPGSSWNIVQNIGPTIAQSDRGLHAATLAGKKRIK